LGKPAIPPSSRQKRKHVALRYSIPVKLRFSGSGYEVFCLLGYNTVGSLEGQPFFWRNTLSLSSKAEE
jgi:hypothetical protein